MKPRTRRTHPSVSLPAKPKRAARVFALLTLAAALAAALTLPGAWRETQRREAFLPQLEEKARHDPYDGRLLALLGGRLMEAGDYPAAGDKLEKAVAAGEKTGPVWLTLASAKAAGGAPQVLGYLKAGASDTGTLEQGEALERYKALGPAASPLEIAKAICPNGPEPLVQAYTQGSFLNGLAQWWGEHHLEDSGFATREAWVRRHPSDAQAQRLWGLALQQNRRYSEAATALQQAVGLAPASPAAHLALADLLEIQSSPAQASLEYIACLKLHPDWLPALLGLGRAALETNLPVTSARVFTEAARVGPQSAEAWIGLGQADVGAQQNYDAALRAFETAARLDPNRTDFLPDYALALRQSNRWPEAEAMLRRYTAAAPTEARGHYLLANILLDNNSTDSRLIEAQAQSQAALRLAPQMGVVQQQAANIAMRRNQPREAVQWLQRVLKSDPSNVNALLTLAHAYQQTGAQEKASQTSLQAAALSRALQKIDVVNSRAVANPSDLTAHAQLAALYARIGQTDKARQEQEVVSLLRMHSSAQKQNAQSLAALIAVVLPPP